MYLLTLCDVFTLMTVLTFWAMIMNGCQPRRNVFSDPHHYRKEFRCSSSQAQQSA